MEIVIGMWQEGSVVCADVLWSVERELELSDYIGKV